MKETIIPPAIEEIKARLLGIIINPEQAKELVKCIASRTMQNFPAPPAAWLGPDAVYIAESPTPAAVGGKVEFDPNSKIKFTDGSKGERFILEKEFQELVERVKRLEAAERGEEDKWIAGSIGISPEDLKNPNLDVLKDLKLKDLDNTSLDMLIDMNLKVLKRSCGMR